MTNWLGLVGGIAVTSYSSQVASAGKLQSVPLVTLTVQAMDAGNAIKQLARATRISLSTSPVMTKEVITYCFHDVPVIEAMTRIADVVDGTWKPEGSGFRLIRTVAQDRAEQKAEFDESVERYRKSIQARLDQEQKLPPWNNEQAGLLASKVQTVIKVFGQGGQTSGWIRPANLLVPQIPVARALVAMEASIDSRDLASLPREYKTVWSSQPTATQVPLPESVKPAVDQFLKDQAEWGIALQKLHLSTPSEQLQSYWNGNMGDLQNAADRQVGVVLLSAQAAGPSNGIILELTAYDEGGKLISQAQNTLGSAYEGFSQALRPVAQEPDELRIVLDGEAKELYESRGSLAQPEPKALSTGLVAKLSHPERFDPLSFIASPMLFAAANSRQVNMVACLDDSSLEGFVDRNSKGTAVDFFLRGLALREATVDLKDGWLMVKPKRPLQTRSTRSNRQDLGKYLRRLITGRPLSVDEQAIFALSLPDPNDSSLPVRLATYLRAPHESAQDQNMLRFYGLLSKQQRAVVREQGLSLDGLTERQLEYVRRMVYGPDPGPYERTILAPKPNVDLYSNGLLREPTEALPDGIPPSGRLQIEQDDSTVVIAMTRRSARSYVPGPTIDPVSLAKLKYAQDHPGIIAGATSYDLSKIQCGVRRKMTFTFQFTSQLSLKKTLEDKSKSGFKKVTLNELPDDFKKQFDQAYEEIRQQYANAKPVVVPRPPP